MVIVNAYDFEILNKISSTISAKCQGIFTYLMPLTTRSDPCDSLFMFNGPIKASGTKYSNQLKNDNIRKNNF